MSCSLRILGVPGSLRAASVNRRLLQLLAGQTPDGMGMSLYAQLGELPLFNPDVEFPPPAAVVHWMTALQRADIVLIASPEYAHGVTGVIKNALDWVVSSEVMVNKPVLVLNASPRAQHADAALRETLAVMNARLMTEASVVFPMLGYRGTVEALLASPDFVQARCQVFEVVSRLATHPAGAEPSAS